MHIPPSSAEESNFRIIIKGCGICHSFFVAFRKDSAFSNSIFKDQYSKLLDTEKGKKITKTKVFVYFLYLF